MPFILTHGILWSFLARSRFLWTVLLESLWMGSNRWPGCLLEVSQNTANFSNDLLPLPGATASCPQIKHRWPRSLLGRVLSFIPTTVLYLVSDTCKSRNNLPVAGSHKLPTYTAMGVCLRNTFHTLKMTQSRSSGLLGAPLHTPTAKFSFTHSGHYLNMKLLKMCYLNSKLTQAFSESRSSSEFTA